MKKIQMITTMLVFSLTICSQLANSMTNNFNLSTINSPEEITCSIEIEAEIFCGSVVFGSTVNGINYPVPSCPSSSASSSGGLWYELVGEGNNVILSTCNAGTNFDTQIAVFQGEGCEVEDLDCIAGNDDWSFSNIPSYSCSYGSGTSAVQFQAEEGSNYFIYITGFSFQKGEFELSVTNNNTPLSISCPGNTTRTSENEACNYTAKNGEFDPAVTGNCATVFITNDYNNAETLDGANFPLGNTTVTWTVSNAGGGSMNCSFDVVVEKSDNPNWLSSYTILAGKEVQIDQSQILSGGVGVQGLTGSGKAKLNNSMIASFVKAPIIDNNNSTLGASIIAAANVSLPVFRNNTESSNNNLKVNNNATMTISASDFLAYKKIEVKKNATLIIDAPELYAKQIKTNDGATIIFNQRTEVMVTNNLQLNKNNTFNSYGQSVYVYTGGKADIKEGSEVNANIFSKKNIKVVGKNNNQTSMTGLFISNAIVQADENTNWNWESDACGWYSSSTGNSNMMINNENLDNIQSYDLSPESEIEISEKEFEKMDFNVYPNPANNITYLDLKQFAGKRVDIVLMDHTTRPCYQQKLESATDSPHSIDISNLANGFYLITVEAEGQDMVIKKLMITGN